MKKVFARIGMYLTVSDEEYEKLKENYYGGYDLPMDLVQRFLKQNEVSTTYDDFTESYIPDDVFDEPENFKC